MAWQLRRARADDHDAILGLETSIFVNDAWSSEAIASELANPQCYYLVAESDSPPGEVVGYAGLFAPQGTHEGDIQTIGVAPAARREGLGRALMNALIAEARKRGAEHVILNVRADNPGAKLLYDSLGFVEIAVRVGYYQPDNVDAIVMRLELPEPRARMAVGV